ncbi:MAG: ceramidase domain-containing protein [Candidatus Dojkabacteria bacterium]
MNDFWVTLFGSSKQPTVEYCGEAGAGLIARLGYFVSNFAYIFLGIYLLTRKNKTAKVFGVISILIGSASAVYDASFSFYAQLIDLFAMFVLINFLLIRNLNIIFNLSLKKKIFFASIFQLAYLASITLLEGQSGRVLFGLGVVAVIASEYYLYQAKITKQIKLFNYALLSFVTGLIIWIFDAQQILCAPTEFLDGRAIYHYITAGTIYLLYLHHVKRENNS